MTPRWQPNGENLHRGCSRKELHLENSYNYFFIIKVSSICFWHKRRMKWKAACVRTKKGAAVGLEQDALPPFLFFVQA